MGFFEIAGVLISGIWDLFTGVEIPGLSGVTIASALVSLFLIGLGLCLVSYMFGFSRGGGDTPRTSSTNKPRISERRKGDEF